MRPTRKLPHDPRVPEGYWAGLAERISSMPQGCSKWNTAVIVVGGSERIPLFRSDVISAYLARFHTASVVAPVLVAGLLYFISSAVSETMVRF